MKKVIGKEVSHFLAWHRVENRCGAAHVYSGQKP